MTRVRARWVGLGVSLLALLLLPWPGMAAGAREAVSEVVSEVVPEGATVQVMTTPARADKAGALLVRVLADGAPVPQALVHVERLLAGRWVPQADLATGEDGRADSQPVLSRDPAENGFRVALAETGQWTSARIALTTTPSRATLSVPARVVDERTARIALTWRTDDAVGIEGQVRLQRRVRKNSRWSRWSDFRTLRTDAQGNAVTTVRPRWTHTWRVVTRAQPWVAAATSSSVRSRNVPPGAKVKVPARAPRPRITLPPQRRAVGKGANVVVSRIPASVWRSMKGVSWRRGCPVGRADLRLVATNYWAFDGYRRRGRAVVAASVVPHFRGAFSDLHRARVPLRSLRLPDRFGRSKRLGGADDIRSMAADNTSVFNCRGVVGQPHRRSPHSWGRSLDLNPWENPFRSARGTVPNTWWVTRSHPDVAWRSTQHRVVTILRRNGFRWTYGHGDLHHFDAVPARATTARAKALERSYAAAVEACAEHACD